MKKALSVLLALALLALPLVAVPASAAEAPLPLLHTEGEKIVTASGREVVLRGTNFGGWGIMEDWFCPYTSPSGEEACYLRLVERFGVDKTHKLFQWHRSNWITETDYRNVAEMGMNCIRLPVWFRNFQKDDNGTWYRKKDGSIDFSELDGVLAMCKKYGLYLILDLHGLPGYQNDYDHCGKSKSMSLFDDTPEAARYRAVVKDFWVQVAKHCAGDPTVAMYDLMNEPLGTSITRDKDFQSCFWDFSDELYRAVRKADPDHIITMEAIWSPDAIAAPTVYGWTNVVYQEHLYDVSNPGFLKKVREIDKCGYNAPFYIGEFYPRGVASFDYLFSIFNDRGYSWTTWTYKGAGPDAANSPWFLYGSDTIEKIDYENDSYETLWQKLGAVLKTDGGEFHRTAFADYAAEYVDGTVDKAALYSLGTVDTVGSEENRQQLMMDKLKAIWTTILDWLRKLRTGDLL